MAIEGGRDEGGRKGAGGREGREMGARDRNPSEVG